MVGLLASCYEAISENVLRHAEGEDLVEPAPPEDEDQDEAE
jgi:hypothetical protein